MNTFKEYRDQPDFGCTVDPEFDAWLIVPTGRNRDSDHLTNSNWDAALGRLDAADPEGDDYRVLGFNHWAVGWVEITIVRPDSPAAAVAAEIEDQLEGYPVLDETDFSRREWEDYLTSWADYGREEFVRALEYEYQRVRKVHELLRDTDPDELRELYEGLIPSGEYCIHESSGASFSRTARHAASSCARSTLAQFVRQVRRRLTAATS